jgi:hypothetical protein
MKINKSVAVETVSSTYVVVMQFHAVLEISSGQELVGFHQTHIQRHDIGVYELRTACVLTQGG